MLSGQARRRLDVLRDSAEGGEHLVGEYHRQCDRDQGLPEILTLVPAQEDLLDHHADHPDDRRRDKEGDDPAEQAVLGGPGPAQRQAEAGVLREPGVLHLEREVAAEQVERAVRHVHHAHQPEDQREAARDDEEERREGEAVEADDRKLTQILTRLDDQPDRDAERRDGDALRPHPPSGRARRPPLRGRLLVLARRPRGAGRRIAGCPMDRSFP